MFKKSVAGFTLVEVLAAIFLIIVGLVGISIAIQQLFPAIKIASYQLTAAYLTQEGVEIVRNIRDTNWLKTQEWNTNLFDTCCGGAGVCGCCQVDYDDSFLTSCPGGVGDYLRIDGGFYNLSSGTSTPFRREIRIASTTADGGRTEVEVSVSWQVGGKNYQASTTEYLYNWK